MKLSLKYLVPFTAIAVMSAACSEKKSAEATPVMPVEVAMPLVDSVTLHKTYPGFLRANTLVDVKCLVDGRLVSKNYNSGDHVVAGQVLFTIESSKYRDAVQQAQAALATAKSKYEYSSRQYAAMQKALEADAVSQMDVIQSKANMDQAEAAIRNAQAALQSASIDLQRCVIKAPISGFVTTSTIDVGNYISGAAQPMTMCTIYDDTSMKAQFSIEDRQFEQMIGEVAPGQTISIPLAFSSPLPHDYVAKLDYVDVAVDKSTGTLQIQAKVDNPYGELRNGMYVNASLPYGTNPHAILVKDAAISTDQAGKFLYTVNDSNRVVYTPVEVGDLYRDSLRIVTKGIAPGTPYVTKAMMRVRDGMEIKPVMTK